MLRIPSDREPTHPGEMLRLEFLEPLGLTLRDLATAIRLPRHAVGDIVRGRRGVTPGIALRLSRLLGTSAVFWMSLQLSWDLYLARISEAEVIGDMAPPSR